VKLTIYTLNRRIYRNTNTNPNHNPIPCLHIIDIVQWNGNFSDTNRLRKEYDIGTVLNLAIFGLACKLKMACIIFWGLYSRKWGVVFLGQKVLGKSCDVLPCHLRTSSPSTSSSDVTCNLPAMSLYNVHEHRTRYTTAHTHRTTIARTLSGFEPETTRIERMSAEQSNS